MFQFKERDKAVRIMEITEMLQLKEIGGNIWINQRNKPFNEKSKIKRKRGGVARALDIFRSFSDNLWEGKKKCKRTWKMATR